MQSLHRRIHLSGTVSLAAYGLLTAISYTSIAHEAKMWLYLFTIGVTTLSPMVLWSLWRRAHLPAGDDALRLPLRYATAFGTVAACALPIFGADFWYYLAEGRLGASGANVYTERLTSAAMHDLPVPTDAILITMPYGPAWVWIGTALSGLVGPRVAWEFAAYKAVMFAGWLATLHLVCGALRDSPRLQLRSVLLLGWLPFPIIAAVGDAHNDIVMVALMTTWLARGSAASTWALVASALVKYASAPIVALAVVDGLVRRSSRTLLVLGAAIGVALVVAVVYWQDGALIAGLQRNRAWRQYTPVALMDWLVRAQGFPVILATIGKLIWRVALGGLVLWYGYRYWRAPSRLTIAALSAAVLVAVVLGAGYLHTHYFLWILPAVLLSNDRFLTALTAPYVLLLPFMQIQRISVIGMSTPFRLTVTLNVLVVGCWIAYACRWRPGLQPQRGCRA